MAGSPYAPPRAAVADVAPAALPTRPRRLVYALRLLWTAFAIDFGVSVWMVCTARWARPELIGSIAGTAVFAALDIWFYIGIWRGRNWARIAGAVFFAFGVVLGLLLPDSASLTLAERVSNISGWFTDAMQIVAFVMLFTGGAAAWFAQIRARQ